MKKQLLSFTNRRRLASRTPSGFTIVELLIVVVVIAILAAITLVAFNNVTGRAKASAAASAAQQAFKKVAVYAVDNADQFPPDLATAGITNQNGTTYQYRTYNSGKNYCITATANNISSYIDNDTHQSPTAGACPGHGPNGGGTVTNYVTNPRVSTTAGWAGYSNTTLATSSEVTPAGTGAVAVTTSAAYGGITWSVAGTTGVDVAPAAPMTFGVYVKAPAGTSVRYNVGEYEGVTAGPSSAWKSFTATGAWQWIAEDYTKTSGTSRARLQVQSATGTTYWVGAGLATNRVGGSYADGTSSNWIWNGTANSSTSTGPAL